VGLECSHAAEESGREGERSVQVYEYLRKIALQRMRALAARAN
jgi:hypothetical protein